MTGDNLAARDPSFSHTEMLSAHKLLDFGMNGLNVAGALFFVAGTLILLRTVTAEGVGRYLMRTSPGTTPSQ